MSRYFHPRVLSISLAGWIAFAILGALATSTTYLPGDLAIARWAQSVSWGPLAAGVPWINALSGASQIVTAVLLIAVVAAFNRRALPFAILSALAPAVYVVLNLLFHKPRPVTGLIKVTEHPAAYSFPSGHATLVFTVVGVLLLAVGFPYFGRILLGLATAVGFLIVLTFGIERIYVGAHYPSDVLGGYLLAFSTISLALSIRSVGGPVIKTILTYRRRG